VRTAPPVRDLLDPAQMAAVRRRSDLWGAWLVAHAWLVIAGSMALVAWQPNPVTYVLAVALIGSRQLGLLILMHDGAHGMLARTPVVNDLLSQWACAYPMFADTAVYRRYHLRHHARTMQDDDPDIVLTGHYPISRASLRRKLWRDLTGRTGYAQRRVQLLDALGGPELAPVERLQRFWGRLGPQVVVNGLLWAGLAAAGHPWFYLTLWVVPALTWQQLVLRVRNIAEHAVVPDRNDPFRNARTTIANWIARALIAPYWVNYHLEHHLVMWVPCYRLPLLRRFLVANGHGTRMVTSSGYLQVLREVTLAAGDDDHRRRPRAVGTFSQGYEA
jgi:fatty acid desaturase